MRRGSRHLSRDGEAGQALVEFAMAITVFLLLIMAVVDLGRLAYQYNGVTETVHELARTTSVYAGSPLGSSSETLSVLQTQRRMVPGLGTPSYVCVDIAGAPLSATCPGGGWVRVTISSTFVPSSPLVVLLGTIVLTTSASAQIQ